MNELERLVNDGDGLVIIRIAESRAFILWGNNYVGIYPGIWWSSSVFHALGADSGVTLANLNGGG